MQHDTLGEYPEGFRVPLGEMGKAFMRIVVVTKQALYPPMVNETAEHADS